jgi:hypothetical protein
MGYPSTPSSPSSLLSLCLPPISSALLLRGTTERNRSSQLRRIEGTCSCFRAWLRGDVLPLKFPFPSGFWFQFSFELWDLQRLSFRISSPPSQKLLLMEVRLIDLCKSCVHLNCRVMCALPEAPHRFVDSSGLRQATCGRGWSTASTTLSGTRLSVLCRVLTPYPKSFFVVLQNTKTQACAFFRMCPRSGKLLPESGTMPAKTRLLRIAATLNWKYLQLHISGN